MVWAEPSEMHSFLGYKMSPARYITVRFQWSEACCLVLAYLHWWIRKRMRVLSSHGYVFDEKLDPMQRGVRTRSRSCTRPRLLGSHRVVRICTVFLHVILFLFFPAFLPIITWLRIFLRTDTSMAALSMKWNSIRVVSDGTCKSSRGLGRRAQVSGMS